MAGFEEVVAYCCAEGEGEEAAGAGREALAEGLGAARREMVRELGEWGRAARRFRRFVEEHRGKIRAKVRGVREAEGLWDVRAELEAARVLLEEPAFAVGYETLAARKGRGPDLTVTYKTHTAIYVEVRRVRGVEGEVGSSKLAAVVCDKVGQMQAGDANLLWLAAGGVRVPDTAVVGAARQLRERVAAKDEAWFAARGLGGSGEFVRQYGRLSGIVVWQEGKAVVWRNGAARVKVREEVVRAIERVR